MYMIISCSNDRLWQGLCSIDLVGRDLADLPQLTNLEYLVRGWRNVLISSVNSELTYICHSRRETEKKRQALERRVDRRAVYRCEG